MTRQKMRGAADGSENTLRLEARLVEIWSGSQYIFGASASRSSRQALNQEGASDTLNSVSNMVIWSMLDQQGGY